MTIPFDVDINFCHLHTTFVALNISLIVAIRSKSIFKIFIVLFYQIQNSSALLTKVTFYSGGTR